MSVLFSQNILTLQCYNLQDILNLVIWYSYPRQYLADQCVTANYEHSEYQNIPSKSSVVLTCVITIILAFGNSR